MIFKLRMSFPNVGGRTTFRCDIVTLQFALTRNIEEKCKNIFVKIAINYLSAVLRAVAKFSELNAV